VRHPAPAARAGTASAQSRQERASRAALERGAFLAMSATALSPSELRGLLRHVRTIEPVQSQVERASGVRLIPEVRRVGG
jgi:hypothetical protein